ncbi:hypothetical protein P5E90_12465 [Clostridium perfringens]|nr:hypothetical protein [Clostridium perfringens]
MGLYFIKDNLAEDQVKLQKSLEATQKCIQENNESVEAAINITNNYADKLKQGTENIELQYANKLKSIDSQLSDISTCVYVESFKKLPLEADDTGRLQRAFDFAGENKLRLICKGNNVFKTSSPLRITKYFNLDLYKAYIESTAETAIEIDIEDPSIAQCEIKNIMIDCKKCKNGMRVNARRIYLKNLYFFNITNVGLCLQGGYEIDVSYCNFRGISPKNKAIIINTTDNYISHCYGVDNNIFIENNSNGNIIGSCHAWIYTKTILPDSIFIDFEVSGIAEKCVSDTYCIAFKCKTIGTSRIINNNCIIHPDYYNNTIISEPPIFIAFDKDEPVYNITIANNWISFPSKEITGYNIDGKLYNIDKIKVLSQIYGNTGNIKDINFTKIKVEPYGDNISTMSSYAIRKNNRVSFKGIFAFNNDIPKTETVIFKLPEYMRPFKNMYSYGVMGININNLSEIVYCFIDTEGNVKIKNINGDKTMSQGLISCEFDVWQPGID